MGLTTNTENYHEALNGFVHGSICSCAGHVPCKGSLKQCSEIAYLPKDMKRYGWRAESAATVAAI
jgi:hypothetical protein